MEGGGSSEAEERNSQSASFDLFDIAELARCCVGVRGTGVLPATETLAQKLFAEAHTIEEYRASDWMAEEIERERSGELRTSMQLMQALNLRRKDRSEAHTCERQSLMRISDADFCLNKKNQK